MKTSTQREFLDTDQQQTSELAQSLHDDIGQRLLAHRLDLQWIIENGGDAIAERAVCLATSLDESMERVRVLARGAALPPLAVPLARALTTLASEFETRASISFRCDVEPLPSSTDVRVRDELFGIAQEAIANAIRHGKPKSIHVTLQQRSEFLLLAIADDGIGIDVSRGKVSIGSEPNNNLTDKKASLGLYSMERRALGLGGAFSISKNEPAGTAIKVLIPTPKQKGQ